MAFGHNVVRIQGSAPGGEVWSINPRYENVEGGNITSYDDLLTWATAIGALNAAKIFPANLLALVSVSGSINSVRCEHIGDDGKLTQAAEFLAATAISGTGAVTKPYQIAWCLSLLTGKPGRSYRGRLFWPAWANPAIGPDMRVTAGNRTLHLAEMNATLKAFGTTAPAPASMRLTVASKVKSETTLVTQLSLGDVLDTQRRRRDSVIEQRTTQPFTV